MSGIRIERVVVTGGRNFTDAARIEADLRALLPCGLRHVAQGGNGLEQFDGAAPPEVVRSADALAWLAGCELGLEGCSYRVNRAPGFYGKWTGVDGNDRRAPLRRNIRMLEAERPDLVLAYPDPGSRGTWHCVREAARRGIPLALWATLQQLVEEGIPLRADVDPQKLGHFVLGPADLSRQLAEVLRGA